LAWRVHFANAANQNGHFAIWQHRAAVRRTEKFEIGDGQFVVHLPLSIKTLRALLFFIFQARVFFSEVFCVAQKNFSKQIAKKNDSETKRGPRLIFFHMGCASKKVSTTPSKSSKKWRTKLQWNSCTVAISRVYVCRQSKWQLSKEFGFHIISGAADYHAQWFPEGDKWSL
jgi:hypothetical protein